MATDSAWDIRPYRPGDGPGIGRLYQEVYGRSRSSAYYSWKLLDASQRVGYPLIWVADTGSRIVSHYAAIPIRFRMDAKDITVLHACDAMTANDYRNRKIFSSLGKTAHRAWADAGIPFLIGLPNDNWGTLRDLLNFQPQFSASWFWHPIQFENYLGMDNALVIILNRIWKRFWRLRLTRKTAPDTLSVEEVTRPVREFGDLWNAHKDSFRAQVVRDQEWIQHRYLQVPDVTYRLLMAFSAGRPTGYLAFRITGNSRKSTAWIADLFTAPKDRTSRAALLAKMVDMLGSAKVSSVRILLPNRSSLEPEFRLAGYFRQPRGFDVCIVPLATDIPAAMRSPDFWFTMLGDYDII